MIIMIRIGSKKENKLLEKCFQEGRRTKRAHRLASLYTVHRDGTKKMMKLRTTYPAAQHDKKKMTWQGNLDVLKNAMIVSRN